MLSDLAHVERHRRAALPTGRSRSKKPVKSRSRPVRPTSRSRPRILGWSQRDCQAPGGMTTSECALSPVSRVAGTFRCVEREWAVVVEAFFLTNNSVTLVSPVPAPRVSTGYTGLLGKTTRGVDSLLRALVNNPMLMVLGGDVHFEEPLEKAGRARGRDAASGGGRRPPGNRADE
jgi:hypothetical protein